MEFTRRISYCIREESIPKIGLPIAFQIQNMAKGKTKLTSGAGKVRHGGEPPPDGLDVGGIILGVFSQLAFG